MFKVGDVCKKLAGRDAGKLCVVVEKIDDQYFLIDGNTRRRKCNIKHLHPEKKKIDIKEKATTSDVLKAFEKAKLPVTKKSNFLQEKKVTKPKK